jgi:hypothetical protein
MEKIRALRVELFVPEELATGEAIAGRAIIFAKYACHIDEPTVVSQRAAVGGSVVEVKEADFALNRRSKRTE